MGEQPSPYPSTTEFSKTLSTALIGPWSRRSLLWTWPYSGKTKPERCKITTLTMTLWDYGFKAAPLDCTVPFLPGVNPVYPTLFKELPRQRSLFFLLELFCCRYNFLSHCAIYQKALSCTKNSSNPQNSEGLAHKEI